MKSVKFFEYMGVEDQCNYLIWGDFIFLMGGGGVGLHGGGGNGLIGGVFRNGSCIVSCVGFNNSADYQEQFSTRLRSKVISIFLWV